MTVSERQRSEQLFELASNRRTVHPMREVLTAIFGQAQCKAQNGFTWNCMGIGSSATHENAK
ncbi:MAG: hypothetical protein R3F37_23515 [Candidatus Competibacteraceae bacterium]